MCCLLNAVVLKVSTWKHLSNIGWAALNINVSLTNAFISSWFLCQGEMWSFLAVEYETHLKNNYFSSTLRFSISHISKFSRTLIMHCRLKVLNCYWGLPQYKQTQFSNTVWKSVFLGDKKTLIYQGIVLHSALFHLLKQLYEKINKAGAVSNAKSNQKYLKGAILKK